MSIYFFEEIKSFQFTASVDGFEDLSLPSLLFCSVIVLPFGFISMGTIVAVVHIDRLIKRIIK